MMQSTDAQKIEQSVEIIRSTYPHNFPAIAMVLGSGLGQFSEEIEGAVEIPYSDIPAFPTTTVAGHEGTLLIGLVNNTPVVCMKGRIHVYEGHSGSTMAAPIRVLSRLGAEILLVTNAAGSLREDMLPGSLMLIEDHINCSFFNPLIGPNDDSFGPRFVDLSNAWDRDLRHLMYQAAESENIEIKKGVYIQCSGPNLETPAEIQMFKNFGASAVGMSTVPECLIANHCGMKVAGICVITNLAAGLADHELSQEEVIEVAHEACGPMRDIVKRFISNISRDP